MRQNPHVRICGGPGSATTLVYPTRETRYDSDTYGHNDYVSSAQASQPTSAGDGVVRFNPEQMEQGAPYPFRLSGSWFVAVKRQEGHIDFLFVQ